MQKDTTYWRARLDAIEQIILEEKGGDRSEINNNSVLLRNGIIPTELQDQYNKALLEHQRAWLRSGNEQPLAFSELCRFNSWFLIHPEKVAGKETITTSREFPITIKGSKENILTTINKTLQLKPKGNRTRVARAKAEAKLKLLNLLKV